MGSERRVGKIMKQKVLGVLLAVVLCFTGMWHMEVQAEDMEEELDYSYLLTDDALIGYGEAVTRGVYYSDGCSIINKISTTKIGAGGATNANVLCKVSVTSIVERQTDTGWARVASWTQTNKSAYSAMISKSLTVATGYWYRVRSVHYAATDTSSSCTSALWMGN